jgi:hypothetical protein
MNEHEQRIAIAGACGWKWKRALNSLRHAWFHVGLQTNWCEHEVKCTCGLPDYLHDLNACYEMEETLSEKDKGEMAEQVMRSSEDLWGLMHATAAQRCEAFLRTKGLWR